MERETHQLVNELHQLAQLQFDAIYEHEYGLPMLVLRVGAVGEFMGPLHQHGLDIRQEYLLKGADKLALIHEHEARLRARQVLA